MITSKIAADILGRQQYRIMHTHKKKTIKIPDFYQRRRYPGNSPHACLLRLRETLPETNNVEGTGNVIIKRYKLLNKYIYLQDRPNRSILMIH